MSEVLINKVDYIEQTQESPEARPSSAAVALQLGALAMQFARVERVPRYEDGERESDAEHSFMLGLVAPELSYRLYPSSLNHALIAQYALVHDLIEVKTGDVSTFNIDDASLKDKEAAEKQALHELLRELPPLTRSLLQSYEQQDSKEARFVRAVDKLLPIVVDIFGQGERVLREDHNVHSLQHLSECQLTLRERMHRRFSEFPQVIRDHELLSDLFADELSATGQLQ